jgi:anti-sigma regulatory factor (Ser/Thr protein kinase)
MPVTVAVTDDTAQRPCPSSMTVATVTRHKSPWGCRHGLGASEARLSYPSTSKGGDYRLAQRSELAVAADPAGPAQARRFVLGQLDLDDAEVAGRIEVLVSELASNAVLYGGAAFVITVEHMFGTIRVEVSDRSEVHPRLGRDLLSGGWGRGLRIVEELSDGGVWIRTQAANRCGSKWTSTGLEPPSRAVEGAAPTTVAVGAATGQKPGREGRGPDVPAPGRAASAAGYLATGSVHSARRS